MAYRASRGSRDSRNSRDRRSFDRLTEEQIRADRASRNSREGSGAKGVEFLGPRMDLPEIIDEEETKAAGRDTNLIIAFVSMIFVGLGNKVFNKLMTIPMHNYPNFLNIWTSMTYVPVCFAYIIPASAYGYIPEEQFAIPKMKFAVMGGLDSIASIMQIFPATYLPGPLIILMLQAAIPISMVISKLILKAEYNKFQYMGAVIVAGGILIVLGPQLSGGGDILWCIVLMLSCVPMTLSSVYKEQSLGEMEVDAMYLNGWVALYQTFFSVIVAIPACYASDPPLGITDLPQNLWDGMKCYVGINSITCNDDDDGCTEDNCNPQGPEFVNIYLIFNQAYNLLIILILKYGSANLLWLALTLMVPLGNVAFTLPFVPEHSALAVTDIIGLVVICFGLGCYRFAAQFVGYFFGESDEQAAERVPSEEKRNSMVTSLLSSENDM